MMLSTFASSSTELCFCENLYVNEYHLFILNNNCYTMCMYSGVALGDAGHNWDHTYRQVLSQAL